MAEIYVWGLDEDTVTVKVGITGLSKDYSYSDRTATFALYYAGNPSPIEVISGVPIGAGVGDTVAIAGFNISYDVDYEIGCTIYFTEHPDYTPVDLPSVEVRYSSGTSDYNFLSTISGCSEFNPELTWTISGLLNNVVECVEIDWYINDEGDGYTNVLNDEETHVFNTESYQGQTVELRAEILDSDWEWHTVTVSYYVPSLASVTCWASRDENTPSTVYVTVQIDARSPVSSILVREYKGGETQTVSGTYDLTFYNMSLDGLAFRATAYFVGGESLDSPTFFLEACTVGLEPWSWDKNQDRINARNALELSLDTRQFVFTVWNDFIEKVREAYKVKNGGVNNVYEEYLNAALMNEADLNSGKTLTAARFNNVRKTIGGTLTTFDVEKGAEENSLYGHYTETGSWEMQTGETAKGSYILDLTKFLNKGIGSDV